ncbi:MAG: hypothetical protein RXO22_09990 [Thermocladium sp.]
MNIRQCIVAMLLKALKVSNLDRLGALCFIIDNLGSFDAFNWSMEGDLPISSEFIDVIEEMARMGSVKVNGSSIALISEDIPDCGWLLERVKSVVDDVLAKYGHMELTELMDEAAFLYQDKE